GSSDVCSSDLAEADVLPCRRQAATGEDESRLVAVCPPEALRFEAQCRLVGARAHHVAVDRLQKLRGELGLKNSPASKWSEVSSQSTLPSSRAMKPSRLAAM